MIAQFNSNPVRLSAEKYCLSTPTVEWSVVFTRASSRGVRAGCRRANDGPTATQLVEDSNDQLFRRMQCKGGHVLQPLIADRRTNSSPLCATGDDLQLACRLSAIADCLHLYLAPPLGDFTRKFSVIGTARIVGYAEQGRLCETIRRPSVCPSMGTLQQELLLPVCYCGPGGQEIAIDCCSSRGRMRPVACTSSA